ncbi:MAG TPA: glycerol-3-phosphate dehydrogenase [Legionellaceae bacterium]|nr:glycerol-3-phosphate dehydrogenase [Legionellaceae bacterium]
MYDVFIIGGGIHGCGCAADAALRGLSVLLCEQDDIASQTSSSSSKLIHGGLRYLEHYDFHLVKKALDEQQILLNIAPHLVHPLPFFLPYRKTLRPAWLLRAGLFLYDILSWSNTLPSTRTLKKSRNPIYFTPLLADIQRGFLFYDGQTDDARLTLSVALQAKTHGASILPHTRFMSAKAQSDHWLITLKPKFGETFQITAKTMINAAGTEAESIAQHLSMPLQSPMTYVKGSHMIVPALYPETHAYLLQAPDQRIVFVIPYHGYSLIGTTDVRTVPHHSPTINLEEIDYLKNVVHAYFPQSIATIVATYSGIRSLCAADTSKASALSRDYMLEYVEKPLPFLSILGGKLTTYRHVAEKAIDRLFPKAPPSRTHLSGLPGNPKSLGYSWEDYKNHAAKQYAWLEAPILTHYLNTYGSRMALFLQNCHQMADLGLAFGAILYQKEVDFLCQEEWAQSVEDILWRRTKLGLTTHEKDILSLETYLKTRMTKSNHQKISQ